MLCSVPRCRGFLNADLASLMQTTVEALKLKFTSHCGTTADSMELQLKDERGRLMATLDNGRMLGYYSPQDGCASCCCPRSRKRRNKKTATAFLSQHHLSAKGVLMTSACARTLRRCSIHIRDTDPHSMSANGWLEDVSKVEKYEISEADYRQRENTYRKFKEQKLKAGRRTTAVCKQKYTLQ